MFVSILLRDSARDFNVEIESSRHRGDFRNQLGARSKNYREPP